jgi:hypothetical protein
MSQKQAQNESKILFKNFTAVVTNLQKPKAVSIQKSDRAKTAPIETDFVN